MPSTPRLMGDGAHGVVYACGALTGGRVVVREELQGKRVRGVFGGRGHFVAIVDGYELNWPHCKDRQQVLEHEGVALGFRDGIKVHQVAFGAQHRVALTLDGQLFSWGTRDAEFAHGELGQVATAWHPVTLTPRTQKPETSDVAKTTPVPEEDDERRPDAAVGAFNEREGPPSARTAAGVCLPRRVHAPKELFFAKVACGAHHSLALTDTGDLYAWGRNFEGQLGIRSTTLHPQVDKRHHGMCAWPKYVVALLGKPRVVDVACGDNFSVVLLQDGSIWRFGERMTGATQRPEEKTDAKPRLLAAGGSDGEPFSMIAVGYAHALAVTKRGEMCSWGLNSYGQLGLGDDQKQSSGTPRAVARPAREGAVWSRVFAGGNYSAAITSDGQLYTWGNGQHGQLGHSHGARGVSSFKPQAVEALDGVQVSSVVCDQQTLFAFAPTIVSSIAPRAGEISGGYELRILGSGFWDSEDLTVRFVPLTEGRLPRGALGTYDQHTREIVCQVPKFSLPGEFAVEVAMNGKHFTSDGHVFEAYKRPSVVEVSRWDARLQGGQELVITVEGEMPRSGEHPLLAFVAGGRERVQIRGAVEKRDPSPRGDPISHVRFTTPVFSGAEVLRCSLELSYNDGHVFSPVTVEGTEPTATRASFELAFHDGCVLRCRPNSFLTRALPSTIELDVRHLVKSERRDELSVRLEVTDLSVSDQSAETRVDVTLPIDSILQDDTKSSVFTITCSVPPLTEWKLSKLDTKTGERVVIVTDWWKFVPRWGFEANIRVSMNNGRDILPAHSRDSGASVFGVFLLGNLVAVFPNTGPPRGGTLVSIAADFFHFDSPDAAVQLKWRGREQTVPAQCVVVPSLDADGNARQVHGALARRLQFTTPPLPLPASTTPVAEAEDDTTFTTPPDSDSVDLTLAPREEVELTVSLDGRNFHLESALQFVYEEPPPPSEDAGDAVASST